MFRTIYSSCSSNHYLKKGVLKETERYNFATNVKKIREKAFARRCNRKTRKKKKGRKNETGFRWTYSPTARINWTGRASIIRCTNPGQEFASKSINLGRSLLYASVSSRRTTYVNQRSSFSPFSPTVSPDTVIFRLLPARPPPPFLYSSPSCVLSRAPSSLSPPLLPIFYPLRPLPPDRASTRIIERFPFRDTLGWILSVRRRTLFSNENFYHLTRFFGGLVYVWESRRMRKDLIIERK